MYDFSSLSDELRNTQDFKIKHCLELVKKFHNIPQVDTLIQTLSAYLKEESENQGANY